MYKISTFFLCQDELMKLVKPMSRFIVKEFWINLLFKRVFEL